MGLWDWFAVKKKKRKIPPHRKYAKPIKKWYARVNRRNPTKEERVLWEELRKKKLGVKFHRQSVMFGWIVDFWCPSRMLIVEVDGKSHNKRKQKEWDKHRDEVLQGMDIKTIRFTNYEVMNELPKVITKIKAQLKIR